MEIQRYKKWKQKKENRGGFREGAGRHEIQEESRRVSTTFSISPTTRKRIAELRARGVVIGKALDDFFETLAKEHGIE